MILGITWVGASFYFIWLDNRPYQRPTAATRGMAVGSGRSMAARSPTQGIKMLMAIMNNGGYSAEVHKFRANGITAKEAVHVRGGLAAAATGFDLRGASVTQPGKYASLFKEHQSANIGSLWDVHIDDMIPPWAYCRVHYGET